MNTLLMDGARFAEYKPDKRVKKDNFIYAEERFNRILRDMLDANEINQELFDSIRSTGSQPTRLYGLPKVHKSRDSPPYRPVMSMPNSYPTKLAKWLDKFLKPHIPNERTIKDSYEFKEKLLSTTIPANSHLVSFDVKSLFTNIPVKETIEHILNILPDNNLPTSKQSIGKLLDLACTNILFSFNNKLFIQTDGMCMGSNLGPTMAEFAMHLVEQNMPSTPIFYKRYVDDVFCIFKSKSESLRFLDDINGIHSNIQFTVEHIENNNITFLDLQITYEHNTIQTCQHLKATNTCIYQNNKAFSPFNHKTAAIRSLTLRAYKLASTQELFENSFKKIMYIFINNGFHYKQIERIKHRIISQSQTPQHDHTEIDKYYIKIPYVRAIEKESYKYVSGINKCLPDTVRIQPVFTTRKTASFFPNKDKMAKGVSSNVIYKYKCPHCSEGNTYIGETTRHFDTRIREHISGKPTPTEVSRHQHTARNIHFKIVLKSKHTKIGEALVYNTIPTNSRINNYRPPFELKLFAHQSPNDLD